MDNATQAQIDAAKKIESIATCKIWDDRMYINLNAAQRRYRGDSTYKIYIDASGVLVKRCGKGMTSDGFDAALGDLENMLTAGDVDEMQSTDAERYSELSDAMRERDLLTGGESAQFGTFYNSATQRDDEFFAFWGAIAIGDFAAAALHGDVDPEWS